MIARFYPWARLWPLGLLVGCASSEPVVIKNPAPAGHEVVGSASSDDRTVIRDADDRIYHAEHADSPDDSAAPAGANQGIP
jgi:hypothetical protein